MSRLQVWIPGAPAPQPRPRAQVVCGHARIYTPRSADTWRETVVGSLLASDMEPCSGPVSVSLDFALPRPASHTRKNGTLRKGKPLHATPRGSSDVDNLAKLVIDAMERVALFANDSQVVRLQASKHYAEPGCEGVLVILEPIETQAQRAATEERE